MKAKHFEINVGFAQIRTGIWGAKDWVSNKAQYIMKNKARNAIPSNGTNEISGTTCYGIIRNEEVFSHNVFGGSAILYFRSSPNDYFTVALLPSTCKLPLGAQLTFDT